MIATGVDGIHEEFSELLQFLSDSHEISFRTFVEGHFKKLLLLAAASYFERRLTEFIIDFAKERIEGDTLVSLIERKVVSRQYHTWFDWKAKNANQFFKLFGEQFAIHAKSIVEENDKIRQSIQNFLEIGLERNRIVHQDFGSYSLEKTSEEIYALYLSASKFVEWFPDIMRSFPSDRTDT